MSGSDPRGDQQAVKTAIIYVPAYHRNDAQLLAACEREAAASGITVTLLLRDVAVVDHLLATGWADLVIVALPHHEIVDWPVRVASDIRARAGATVVDLPAHACGGRHRAPSDSLIGRVEPLRHVWSSTRRDDGGFADRFLAARLLRSRHMSDT